MPTFPRYQTQGNITSKPPLAMREGAGQEQQAKANLAAVAQDITFKWAQAIDTMQYSTRESTLDVKLNDIYSRAQSDPEYSNSDKYFDEANAAYKESLQGFSNPRVRDKASIDFNYKKQMMSIRIDSLYKNKLLEHDTFVIGQQMQSKASERATYGIYNTKQRNNVDAQMFKSIEDRVNAKIISKDDAIKIRQDYLKTAALFDIANDFSVEDKQSAVLDELNKSEQGIYKDIPETDRQELKNKVRLQIDRNKQFKKSMTIDNRLNVLEQFINGNINDSNYESILRTLTVEDPVLGEAIRKGSDITFSASLDDEAFEMSVNDVFSSATREDISTFLMNTLNANDNKAISRDRLAILFRAALDRAKTLKVDNNVQELPKDIQQTKKDSYVDSILDITNIQMSRANILHDFLAASSSGGDIDVAYNDAIEKEKKRSNHAYSKYKLNDKITAPNGRTGTVVGFDEAGNPLIKPD